MGQWPVNLLNHAPHRAAHLPPPAASSTRCAREDRLTRQRWGGEHPGHVHQDDVDNAAERFIRESGQATRPGRDL